MVRPLPLLTLNETVTVHRSISYSPTLEQQNSVSSKGLNADFIIHYDVELRDIMGDIQVSEKAEFFLTYPNTD